MTTSVLMTFFNQMRSKHGNMDMSGLQRGLMLKNKLHLVIFHECLGPPMNFSADPHKTMWLNKRLYQSYCNFCFTDKKKITDSEGMSNK